MALLQKRRDNHIISKQKEEVESQNHLIAFQKAQVDEKNKEITDSITYAKLIQEAILPDYKFWLQNLSTSFVLYQPKDIVAGDFYWMEKNGDNLLFAAADCTGHGVPGAMVSVVCHNALNRAVREYQLTSPAEILGKVRELVVETFASDYDKGANIKDGMDIAICSWNQASKSLIYAGANNPLWVVTSCDLDLIQKANLNDLKLFEVKADKQPIGAYDLAKPFNEHTINRELGDTIYIFSDGFPDQFGGTRGKKLKQQAFREQLLAINKQGMPQQKEALWQAMINWMGDYEQVDDICVIGLRV